MKTLNIDLHRPSQRPSLRLCGLLWPSVALGPCCEVMVSMPPSSTTRQDTKEERSSPEQHGMRSMGLQVAIKIGTNDWSPGSGWKVRSLFEKKKI